MGSLNAMPGSLDVFLDPGGGLHDMPGRHIADDWWAQRFAKDRVKGVRTPFVIVVGLTDEKSTTLSALTTELAKIKAAAEPDREITIYVQLDGLLPSKAKGSGVDSGG
jgi:hypothetical protein